MAAAQIAKKLKDKRQKNYIEGIFKKVIYWRCFLLTFLSVTKSIMTKKAIFVNKLYDTSLQLISAAPGLLFKNGFDIKPFVILPAKNIYLIVEINEN